MAHTITTEDDDEALGTYELIVGVAHPANDVGQPNTYHSSLDEITVTVRDGEQPNLWIETVDADGSAGNGNPYPHVQVPRSITEGEEMFFVLRRKYNGPQLTANVEGTGAENFVTGTVPTTVTIAQGERSKRFSVMTLEDSIVEEHGEFTMTLLDGVGYRPGDSAGRQQSAGHWIYDNDTFDWPLLEISADVDWVNEGEDVLFTLTRSGDTEASLDAEVRIFHTQGSADNSGAMQEVVDATFTFAAGSETATVTKATVDDSINRGDSYVVAVLNPGLYYIQFFGRGRNQDNIWVQDDDRPTTTLTPATDTFEEGNAQEITLNRAGDATYFMRFETRVETTVHHPDPETESTSSYVHPFSHLFQGESSKVNRIRSAPRVEALGASGIIRLLPFECIDSPGFSNNGGCGLTTQYLLGSENEQTFTIYSDLMGVRIEADQTSVGEGGAVTFTLHRHGGKPSQLANPLHVTVMVTQDGDFISGTAPQTVTFAAGQTTATLSVPTSNDTIDEADGSITATLVRPISFTDVQHAYTIGEYRGTAWAVTEVTTAVTDDDYDRPVVSVLDAEAVENEGSIEFTVSLDRANFERVATVDWATADDGSTDAATSGLDYTAASGTLTFAIGETEKTVTIALVDDELDEANETFNIVLSNPVELYLEDATGSGAIQDDERALAVIVWSSTFHTEEGDVARVWFRRLVAVAPGTGVTWCADLPDHCYDADADPGNVPLTINVMVSHEGDFISGSMPTTLTFEPGNKFAELVVATEDDSVVEATGTIIVEVLQGAGYALLNTGSIQGQPGTNPHPQSLCIRQRPDLFYRRRPG